MEAAGFLNRFFLYLVDKMCLAIIAANSLIRDSIEQQDEKSKDIIEKQEDDQLMTMRVVPPSVMHLDMEVQNLKVKI